MITGAGGQLGRELSSCAPAAARVRAFTRQELDLRDPQAAERAIAELRPELIVNAAAYTAVDRAEEEQEQALAVNATGVAHLAQAAARYGSRLIHISTDFVFAGDRPVPYGTEDETAPRSVYGRSKRQGEVLALAGTSGATLVIRTAWLYSRFGHNFVKTMLRLMRDRDSVSVVADQVGSPTWARNLAAAIWRAAERPELGGVLHYTDAGVASWYDFAMAVQEEAVLLGLLRSAVAVRPLGSEDYPTAAARPAFSVLDCRGTWRALELDPCHWRVALRSMLTELRDLTELRELGER